jgi:hypothetical protein
MESIFLESNASFTVVRYNRKWICIGSDGSVAEWPEYNPELTRKMTITVDANKLFYADDNELLPPSETWPVKLDHLGREIIVLTSNTCFPTKSVPSVPSVQAGRPTRMVVPTVSFAAAASAAMCTVPVALPPPEPVVPAPESVVPAPELVAPAPESVVPAPELVAPAPESVVPAPELAAPAETPLERVQRKLAKEKKKSKILKSQLKAVNDELSQVRLDLATANAICGERAVFISTVLHGHLHPTE